MYAPLYCHLTDAYLSNASDFIGVELLAVNGDLDELGNSRKVPYGKLITRKWNMVHYVTRAWTFMKNVRKPSF